MGHTAADYYDFGMGKVHDVGQAEGECFDRIMEGGLGMANNARGSEGGNVPWWRESGVLHALDRAFTSNNGGQRPGAGLVASTGSIGDVVAWLQRES